jgi:hypothetical protein
MKLSLFISAIVGWLTVLILGVSTYDYHIAKEQEIERCTCKSEIKERQLYASMCQAPSIKGPWLQECLYK